jgi:sugar phosphate isomerase/epimerase
MASILGIQSYCFREFKDNATTAQMVKDLGLGAIELCGVHVDFQKPAGFGAAIAPYRDRGVAVVMTGVNRISGREPEDRNLFEFLKASGARTMSVDFAPEGLDDALQSAEKLSEQYGVRLAIHNHGGRHWLGSSQALSHVFKRTSPRVGLCLDTAWALDSHEDPIAMVEQFRDRLYAVHLKDFVFDRARTPEDVVVGTGNLDLKKLDDKLKAAGFAGLSIIEYEGDPKSPMAALKKCTEAIRHGMSMFR